MLRVILALCALALCSPAFAQTEYTLGADNPGGSYYLYGGGISTWVNQKSKTLRLTSQTTRGSVENARLLGSKRLAFGLVNAVAAHQAKRGVGQFQTQKIDNLKGIAVLDVAPLHVVAYTSSGIKTMGDLAGKRVSIGAPGSGSATAANLLFPLLGLNGKVKIQNLGFSESASNLRDGNIAAFLGASALPMPAVVDLTSSNEVTLVPIGADAVSQLRKDNPSYSPVVIPGGTYTGIAKDVGTIGVASLMLVRDDIPDDVVYELVSQMYTPEAMTYMKSIYRAWDPSAGEQFFKDIDIPLHPGALRLYKEKGLLK